jgi:hypothetical protein
VSLGIGLLPVALFEDLHNGFQLALYGVGGHICLALFEGLAYAEDDAQLGVKCGAGL